MKFIVEMTLERSNKTFYLTNDDEYCDGECLYDFCDSTKSAARFDSRVEGWKKIVELIEESVYLGVKDENYYRVIGVKE